MRPPIRSRLSPVLVRAVSSWLVAAGLLVASMLAGAPASHALDSPDYTCHISGRLSQYGVVKRDNPWVWGPELTNFRAYYLAAGGICSSHDPARPWVGHGSLSGSMVEFGGQICPTGTCPPGIYDFHFLTDYELNDNYLSTPDGTRHVWVELTPKPVDQFDNSVFHPATQGIMTISVWHAEECDRNEVFGSCVPDGHGAAAFVYDDPLRSEPFNGGDLTFEGTLAM